MYFQALLIPRHQAATCGMPDVSRSCKMGRKKPGAPGGGSGNYVTSIWACRVESIVCLSSLGTSSVTTVAKRIVVSSTPGARSTERFLR